MNGAFNQYSRLFNVLLTLTAAFTLALTFYSCTRFYTYLPTADTWVYTDFLAQAAQGHLEWSALFEKHNGVHLIALPKLLYYFDVWLTQGSGALLTLLSLVAMLLTTAVFVAVIFCITTISKQEKNVISLITVILLMSACQAESLMNPANLQWSLLVFAATLTAWFYYRYVQKKSALNLTGVYAGMVLVSLTSASPLLIIIPLGIFVLRKKITIRWVVIGIILLLVALGAGVLLFSEIRPLIPTLLVNWLKFTLDFLAPPVERLHSSFATVIVGALLLCAFFKCIKSKVVFETKEHYFFAVLVLFALFVILSSGVLRSYTPTAFTFRFVNIGLLFNAALFPLLYLSTQPQTLPRFFIMSVTLLYIGLLTIVNVTEASAFGYGRNHMKLTQVAHALDINDSFVVSAMPGTVWEKIDFDFVQANKHMLQDVGTGIYSTQAFKNVGKPISALGELPRTICKTTIIKMRRLVPEQAAYRLLGETHSDQGRVFSRAYFVDEKNIIRGFAIPMEPGKNILKNLLLDEQWAGFVNLDQSAEQESLTLYAYSDSELCQGDKVSLPAFVDLRKAEQKKPAEAAE